MIIILKEKSIKIIVYKKMIVFSACQFPRLCPLAPERHTGAAASPVEFKIKTISAYFLEKVEIIRS